MQGAGAGGRLAAAQHLHQGLGCDQTVRAAAQAGRGRGRVGKRPPVLVVGLLRFDHLRAVAGLQSCELHGCIKPNNKCGRCGVAAPGANCRAPTSDPADACSACSCGRARAAAAHLPVGLHVVNAAAQTAAQQLHLRAPKAAGHAHHHGGEVAAAHAHQQRALAQRGGCLLAVGWRGRGWRALAPGTQARQVGGVLQANRREGGGGASPPCTAPPPRDHGAGCHAVLHRANLQDDDHALLRGARIRCLQQVAGDAAASRAAVGCLCSRAAGGRARRDEEPQEHARPRAAAPWLHHCGRHTLRPLLLQPCGRERNGVIGFRER
jgi:hypothetical protein